MKTKKNWKLIFINVVCLSALLVVIFPLLFVGMYNYPSADDWSYGRGGYQIIRNGGGLLSVLKSSVETTWETYMHVEGRFAGIFMATLQPGIWGEKYYGLVVWILIGSIVLSTCFFFRSFLCENCYKENKWLWFPVVAPMLIMQLLYCPSPVESFYWYTGAMYYTFSYGLSLILLVLFWRMGKGTYTKGKYVLCSVLGSLLAVLVGGANFGTSLACFLTLFIMSIIFLVYHRKFFFRTWFITLLTGISLLLCILAPGNTHRINTNFGGETRGALEAILMSLVRSATNIYSWTNIKVILMILFIIPFAWKCVKNISYEFKLPGIFTLLTFGLYASQITATMYVDGTTGGGRMADILFYSYNVWMIGNVIYWLGWLNKRQNRVQKLMNDVQHRFGKLLLPYCAVIGAILVCIIYTNDLRQITSYRAYRDWRQGWAQQYATEWDDRIAVLKDENVKRVEFTPLSVYPEMILYTDLQDEEGYTWVNTACASYYEKEWITIVPPKN